MKIGIVSNIYKPYTFGGAEISTELLARGLHRNGHEVFILTASIQGSRSVKEMVDDIPVYRLATGLPYTVIESAGRPQVSKALWHSIDLWNPIVYSQMKKILGAEKPDIVHTNVLAGLSTAVWQAARKWNIPVVHTLRDYYLLCVRSNLMRRSGKLCRDRCGICQSTSIWKHIMSRIPGAVASVSDFVLEKHRQEGFFEHTPSIVIPNAIDGESDSEYQRPKKSQDEPIEAIFLGRMEFAKGPQDALEALRLAPDMPVKLHLCGEGPLLNELRQKYKSDNRITFEGRVDGDRKISLLRAADVMLVPSRWFEPFNRTVIEAYQYGLAVVGSRIGGIPEIVEDGATGRLYEPGDCRALADILLDLSAHHDILTRLRQRAATRTNKFLLRNHVPQYEAFYAGSLR